MAFSFFIEQVIDAYPQIQLFVYKRTAVAYINGNIAFPVSIARDAVGGSFYVGTENNKIIPDKV